MMMMVVIVIPCMCYADDDDDTHLCDLPKIIMAVVVAVPRFFIFIFLLIHFTYVVRRTIITTDCCRLTPAAYIWYVMPNEAFKKH